MAFTTPDFPGRTFDSVEQYKELLKNREELKKKFSRKEAEAEVLPKTAQAK